MAPAPLGVKRAVDGELVPAHGTPIGRIEHKHDWVAAKLAQRHRLVGGAAQAEIGRAGSSPQNHEAMLRHARKGLFRVLAVLLRIVAADDWHRRLYLGIRK